MVGNIPTTQVTITGGGPNVITGKGWTATIWTDHINVTLSPASLVLSFIFVPIWDSDSADSSTGINNTSVTFPSTTQAGYFNSTTVRIALGSSVHLIGISFWALVM
jgi:hypothetical protein